MMGEEESTTTEKNHKLVSFLPITITLLCIISQIVLTFVLWDNFYNLDFLVYIGYFYWGLGAFFGIWPIIVFRRKGGVKKGDSYVNTTKLVRSDLYSIVRYPQYLAGIITSLALAFMSQHWVVDILVVPPIILMYIDTMITDKGLIKKFGEEYIQYIKEVPRLSPILGLIKLIIRRIKNRKTLPE